MPTLWAFNAYKSFMHTYENGIAGDRVELGYGKVIISALLGKLCEYYSKGKVWSFDSFEGMFPCGDFDMACDEDSVNLVKTSNVQLKKFYFDDFLYTCHDIMGLKKETITPIVGWVEETYSCYKTKIEKIKIFRIDFRLV